MQCGFSNLELTNQPGDLIYINILFFKYIIDPPSQNLSFMARKLKYHFHCHKPKKISLRICIHKNFILFKAEKTIEKKDAKLKEINSILEEEINPTLSKLKEERAAYFEFQKIQRELEHLTKVYVAYQFVCAEETSTKSADDFKQVFIIIIFWRETG